MKIFLKHINGMIGISILIIAMWLLKFDYEALCFWFFFLTLAYWRLDPRISIGFAIAGLIFVIFLSIIDGADISYIFSTIDNKAKLIYFTDYLGISDRLKWTLEGEIILTIEGVTEKIAIWVYFFLIIGVALQISEFWKENKQCFDHSKRHWEKPTTPPQVNRYY